jgi:hypothetical protein
MKKKQTKTAVIRRIKRLIRQTEFLIEVQQRSESGQPLTAEQQRRLYKYIWEAT